MAEIYKDFEKVPFDMNFKGSDYAGFISRVKKKYPDLEPPDLRIIAMDPEFQAEFFQLSALVEISRPKMNQALAFYWGHIPGLKISFVRK